MGKHSKWFRYVDDVLVIMPKSVHVENKSKRLDGVNVSTVELRVEVDNKISFLDTLIHRNENKSA